MEEGHYYRDIVKSSEGHISLLNTTKNPHLPLLLVLIIQLMLLE